MTTSINVQLAKHCIWEARETMLFMYQAEDHARGNTDNFSVFSKLAHKSRLSIKKNLQDARELLEV